MAKDDDLELSDEFKDEFKNELSGSSQEATPSGHQKRVTNLPVERSPNGQSYYLCNMVSPVNPNQKCDVYAFRILAICEDQKSAAKAGLEYGQRDPRFNIYTGKFGEFIPWVFDPDKVADVESHQKEMRSLLESQEQQQQEAEDHFYDRIMSEKMAAHKARFAKKQAEEEGRSGDDVESSRGNAVSAKYNIRQLTHVCRKRLEELKFWKERFLADFTDEDRAHADAYDYPPDPDVAPMFSV